MKYQLVEGCFGPLSRPYRGSDFCSIVGNGFSVRNWIQSDIIACETPHSLARRSVADGEEGALVWSGIQPRSTQGTHAPSILTRAGPAQLVFHVVLGCMVGLCSVKGYSPSSLPKWERPGLLWFFDFCSKERNHDKYLNNGMLLVCIGNQEIQIFV